MNHLLSIIEKLPKTVENFGNALYSLKIYVTAWNNLCVCYENSADFSDRLFSTVIEKNAQKFLTVEAEEVSTVNTIDEAVNHIVDCLHHWGCEVDPDLIVKCCAEPLDLDFQEESERIPNVEVDYNDKIFNALIM